MRQGRSQSICKRASEKSVDLLHLPTSKRLKRNLRSQAVLQTIQNLDYLKWLPPHSADPLPGISVSGLWFRCFRNGISKSLAPERLDFNISGSGASRFQDFQLRSVRISIFLASEQLRSVEIRVCGRPWGPQGRSQGCSGGCLMVPGCSLGGPWAPPVGPWGCFLRVHERD